MRTIICRFHRVLASGKKLYTSRFFKYPVSLCKPHQDGFESLRPFSTGMKWMKAMPNVLAGKEDRYRGLHVELQEEMSAEDFDQILSGK